MTDEQIKHMVDRFLMWKLPENFNPDDGISFDRIGSRGTPYEYTRTPSGTNLFGADQAEVMVRHMLEGLPTSTDADRRVAEERERWGKMFDNLAAVARKNGAEQTADAFAVAASAIRARSKEAQPQDRCPACNQVGAHHPFCGKYESTARSTASSPISQEQGSIAAERLSTVTVEELAAVAGEVTRHWTLPGLGDASDPENAYGGYPLIDALSNPGKNATVKEGIERAAELAGDIALAIYEHLRAQRKASDVSEVPADGH